MEEEREGQSLADRMVRYYAQKTTNAREKYDDEDQYRPKRRADWSDASISTKGFMNRLVGNLSLPYKSIALFVSSWMLLEIGGPLLIIAGVVTAGSVWDIPTAIPCMYIGVYCTLLVSGANLIRSLITELSSSRDNLAKALFRGYFWSILSVGLILLTHTYFRMNDEVLFLIPIVYFIPIEINILGTGGTVPVPIPLGFTGMYLDILVAIIVYAIGITGSCIGGIEVLRYMMGSPRQQDSYGAVFKVLFLAVFPSLNVYFSSIFLTSMIGLFWRLLV